MAKEIQTGDATPTFWYPWARNKELSDISKMEEYAASNACPSTETSKKHTETVSINFFGTLEKSHRYKTTKWTPNFLKIPFKMLLASKEFSFEILEHKVKGQRFQW